VSLQEFTDFSADALSRITPENTKDAQVPPELMGMVKKMHMHWNPLVCPDGDARLSWSKLKQCMQKNSTCTLFSCAANQPTESASVALAKRGDGDDKKRMKKTALVLNAIAASAMFLLVGMLLLNLTSPLYALYMVLFYIFGLFYLNNFTRIANTQ
jgi:hypothetical protein